MFHKILVALDTSKTGQRVFEEALALAKATHASLLLLHVLSPLNEGYPSPVFPGPDSIYPGMHSEAMKTYLSLWETYEHEGLEMLRSLTDEATKAGVGTESSQNLGDPGRVICELASSWNADLILMGRRGHSGFSEFFLGSVSNYVTHHAACSVLIVQGNGKTSPEVVPENQVAAVN